jgi:transcriptional regulator with XRE-family HTH domain
MNSMAGDYVANERTALRDARIAAGLTIEEAAKQAGFKSKSGWAMVESGANTPPAVRMRLMARVVSKRPSEVFEEMREDGEHGGQQAG